jgi:hypothetical protein
MLELLKRIQEGQFEFTPGSEGVTADDFNLIANQLLQAAEDDLIVILKTHKESDSGNDYYDAVVVDGLTLAGIDLLGDV